LLACALSAGCSFVQFGIANATDVLAGAHERRDIAYGPDPRQHLDVYTPWDTGSGGAPGHRVPVVVFWYGGTWVTGDKRKYRFVGIALAKRGLVAVLPDYRLYPKVTFPAFDADGASAVAWTQRHAAEFGGDPANIVLMGHSAGGQIAAMVALNHEYLRKAGGDPSCVSGLVGLSGTYVLVPDSDELRAIFPAPYTEAQWQPVRFVDETSPPTLLLHGLKDREVLPQEARDLRDALSVKHVRVELILYPHRGHGATVASFAPVTRWLTPALRDTVGFVKSLAPASHCSPGAAPSSTAPAP
jgi:acetyl esterase/lipase